MRSPIKLTVEQQDKLLEMCRKLFPEHIWSFENDFADEGMIDCDIHLSKPYFKIYHWFEFCFCNLVDKIQISLPDTIVWRKQPPYVGNIYGWKEEAKWTLYSEFTFHYPKACKGGTAGSLYPQNPIDFLYKEFKKIK